MYKDTICVDCTGAELEYGVMAGDNVVSLVDEASAKRNGQIAALIWSGYYDDITCAELRALSAQQVDADYQKVFG